MPPAGIMEAVFNSILMRMKHLLLSMLGAMLAFPALADGTAAATTSAMGWPADYEGVMLQGFYWESYDDTEWTNLESQADKLAASFKLIWVPNSAKAAQNPGMGFEPVYWFTNHNSSFGTENQIRQMIKAFKSNGVGVIETVAINHRSGTTNATDFPAEKWRGQTWKIGRDGICETDEVAAMAGQGKPTGAPDTGEDYDGSRDLDHTNSNVQNNCKAYCRFLLQDMEYAGFSYDFVKGYSGSYVKIYNENSEPEFSVGDYYDGSFDAVKGWIDATGKTSAAYDYPCKFAINKAWSDNDMTQLVWRYNGETMQPAGLIHDADYRQYAVTFVDNHETSRNNEFTGDIVAANAFILCSPGTPCVFLSHWKSYKSELQRLIEVRNAVGLHNNSAVRVLKSETDCYMAEVTGTKDKLVVKIGSAQVSPESYDDADIMASGANYCVWSKVAASEPQPVATALYLIGNINGKHWELASPVKMEYVDGVFTADVTIDNGDDAIIPAADGSADGSNPVEASKFGHFTFVTTTGDDWDAVNLGDRYGSEAGIAEAGTTSGYTLLTPGEDATIVAYPASSSAASATSWRVPEGKYTVTADLNTMKVRATPQPSTAITDIESDETAPAVYYTLQGVRVDAPSVAGLYIVVRGASVAKVYVK